VPRGAEASDSALEPVHIGHIESHMGTSLVTRQQVLTEINEAFGLVPGWLSGMPDAALTPFWTIMRDFYLAETVIPNKYKELIGIAVSGATRCKYCALFHTEGARLGGATDAEIAEAAFMGGVTMLGSTYLNGMQVDYDQFHDETMQIVKIAKAKAAQQSATNKERRATH
jgi:AhpD family alkylhydroperoxidase